MKNLLIPVLTIALFFTACTEEDCKTCQKNRTVVFDGELVSEDVVEEYGTLCGINLDDIETQEPDVTTVNVGGFDRVTTVTTVCN